MTIYTYNGEPNIVFECIKHKGKEFVYPDFMREARWTQEYVAKKKLFGYEWVERRKVYMSGVNSVQKEINPFLDPPGIVCLEKTVLEKDTTDREPLDSWEKAKRDYCTNYKILVTEEYSKELYDMYDGSRLVTIGSEDEMAIAEGFRDRVVCHHKEILEPIFENGISKYRCASRGAFGDFEYDTYMLKELGMKPLQNIEQALGLVMAAGEAFQERIPKDQIWFISIQNYVEDKVVSITKWAGIQKKGIDDGLKAW